LKNCNEPREVEMGRWTDEDVARVAALRYWRAGDARVVIEAWRRSGESLRAFAERHGIHRRRLIRWAAQLERAVEPVAFHPVRLVEGSEEGCGGGAPLEIVFGEGVRVRVGPGFAARDLATVLAVLGVGVAC
jgi:hypothetical protein